MNTARPIARAIDVGYGNTKYTLTDGMDLNEIQCAMFPSVAPVSSRRGLESFGSPRDTTTVEVEGTVYEVGPDAMMGMAANASRTLDIDFSKKPEYMALVRGALARMNVERVDHLFVGLPVSTFEALGRDLEQRLTGVHRLNDREVDVKACKVVPQPVGGMWDFGVRNNMLSHLQSSNSLLIDPGYFTLDWVVTRGTKMVGVRSGAANNAGMAAILRAIGESMATTIKERDGKPAELTESSLDRMDEAIRLKAAFRFNGKVEDLTRHMEAGRKVIDDGLAKLAHQIGTKSDIDNVIIVGGASHLYQDAVVQMFGGYDVRVAQQAVFANVRGFQMLSCSRAGLLAKAPKAELTA